MSSMGDIHQARKAAHTRWGNAGQAERTAQAETAQEGLREKFRREVRADHPEFTDDEVEAAARNRYSAHMSDIRMRQARKTQS